MKIKQLKRGQILKHDTQLLEKTQQPTKSPKNDFDWDIKIKRGESV